MANQEILSQSSLRQLLSYDRDTGLLVWLISRGKAKLGSVAGAHDAHGYVVIRLYGVLYKAHRLIWLYETGSFPVEDIDHINGVRDDNRWANLRQATRSDNQQNMKMYANNTSGYPGVVWDASRGKWAARIRVNGAQLNLGRFLDASEAFAAYKLAKSKYHPFNPSVPDR